jgi:hypothetical protein
MHSIAISIMTRRHRGPDDLPGPDAEELRARLEAIDPCRGGLDAAAPGRLREIHQQIVSGQAGLSPRVAGPASPPHRYGIRRGRPGVGSPWQRSRLTRPAGRAAFAATAVALSSALAAALVVAGTRPAAQAPGRIALDAFLRHAAAVARTQDTPAGRRGQLFYVKYLDVYGSSPGVPPARSCQVAWDPPPSIGGTAGGAGTSIPTRPAPRFCASALPAPPAGYPEPWFTDHGYPAWDHNGYPPPMGLPAEPGALLAALYRAAAHPAPPGGGTFWGTDPTLDPSRADIVFVLADRLLQAPISSRLRSALFAATARLPGVELIRNAADAAGRRGVEVAIPSHGSTVVPCAAATGFQGFILDPGTYRYLGERDVMHWALTTGCPPLQSAQRAIVRREEAVKPHSWTIYGMTAVLRTGFVSPARP